MLKSVEFLPHHVVELILQRLPVKHLLRFKSISKTWKSTIESQRFHQEQLVLRTQSRDPDVLFVVFTDSNYPSTRIELGLSIVSTIKFPFPNISVVCRGICDGLIFLFDSKKPSVVVNPVTKWQLHVPISNVQKLAFEFYRRGEIPDSLSGPGFGKDKFTGTYKLVWLYNSDEFDLENETTCEVFDFSTHAWRYVVPASPYRILDGGYHDPVHLDGSLYWLTEEEEEEETKVFSFDLHTKTFQLICKAPFGHICTTYDSIGMCILDNSLCVCKSNGLNQVIWSFDSDTWKRLYLLARSDYPPIEILEKKMILFQCYYDHSLVMHDLDNQSYDVVYEPATLNEHFVSYFES